MYRGYCAHSSLVGVCSSGVCLIIRTAITNAWQNCPCAQAATGDVDCSASVLTRPAARLSAQCHSRCSACRGLWSSALPIRLLGKLNSLCFTAAQCRRVCSAAQGRIYTDAACPELGERERAAAYAAMAATLAALHSVDPAAVGLQRFGRERGYCRRQARLLLHASQRLCSCHHTLPPHSHPAASRPPEVAGNLQPG